MPGQKNIRLPTGRLPRQPKSENLKPLPVADRRFSDEELTEIRLAVARRIRQAFGTENNAEIARRCKTTNSTIKTYTDGLRLPMPEMLIQMQRATGASIDWLLTGRGQMFPINNPGEIFSKSELKRIDEIAVLRGRSVADVIRAMVLAQADALDRLND